PVQLIGVVSLGRVPPLGCDRRCDLGDGRAAAAEPPKNVILVRETGDSHAWTPLAWECPSLHPANRGHRLLIGQQTRPVAGEPRLREAGVCEPLVGCLLRAG